MHLSHILEHEILNINTSCKDFSVFINTPPNFTEFAVILYVMNAIISTIKT